MQGRQWHRVETPWCRLDRWRMWPAKHSREVHVSAGLVGTKAGILTVPGWSLRLGGQPRGSLDYNLFRIQSQTLTVRAPAPRHLGRYTIRINRDSSGDHSAIAQVRVTFRSFD